MIQIGYSELTKRYYFLPEKGKKVDITEDIQEIIKSSRPSIDIVDELRKLNPYQSETKEGWKKCCDKLQELLTQQK